jgi:ribosomal protein L11 methyltransferase
LAEPRHWPALDVRSPATDPTGLVDGLVAAALDDFSPIAIQDLIPPPLPPGGLWDPTAPPASEPPPTPVAWRVCFSTAALRDAAVDALGALGLDLTVEALDLPDDDWVARSQQANRAVTAGRFIVAPPWDIPAPVPAEAVLIVIDPSMGFGTGHHQTTRLCLRLLSTLEVRGRTALDLGTGSGVLALAASLAGARTITGIDIDDDAVLAARRSAVLNTVPVPVTFQTADVFSTPWPSAELVFANLTGAMLIRTATQLAALVAPDGQLVVSGFVDTEAAEVESALAGFTVTAREREDEWCACVLRRHPREAATATSPRAAVPSCAGRSSS